MYPKVQSYWHGRCVATLNSSTSCAFSAIDKVQALCLRGLASQYFFILLETGCMSAHHTHVQCTCLYNICIFVQCPMITTLLAHFFASGRTELIWQLDMLTFAIMVDQAKALSIGYNGVLPGFAKLHFCQYSCNKRAHLSTLVEGSQVL